jgi:hypothetical protein
VHSHEDIKIMATLELLARLGVGVQSALSARLKAKREKRHQA